MNKFTFLFVILSFIMVAHSKACTEDEFKALDKYFSEIQENHRAEKSGQFDAYLQQIKTKKNLNDKELFAYKTKVLNHPDAKILYDKDRKVTFLDYFNIKNQRDCKTLKKWANESMASANKQWDIVFAELEKELQPPTSQ